MTKEKEPTTRVAMLFPVALKDQIQSVAGNRGVTSWVLNACREKLGQKVEAAPPKPQIMSKPVPVDGEVVKKLNRDVGDARFIAQQLADAFVRMGDYEDPHAILQTIGLPEWIDTRGWPEMLADLVEKPEPEPVPEPVKGPVPPEPVPLDDEEEEAADGGPPAQVPQVDLPERVPGESNSDFLNKVMAKAGELGIARASDLKVVDKPEPDEPGFVSGFVSGDELLDQVLAEPGMVEAVEEGQRANAEMGAQCDDCGTPLRAGECPNPSCLGF